MSQLKASCCRHANDRLTQKNSLDEIVFPVMSTLVMLHQGECGLWVRNGQIMHGLHRIYNDILTEHRCLDLVMVGIRFFKFSEN